MLRLGLALLILVACDDRHDACDDPPYTTYSCSPIPNGEWGCVGGPVGTYPGAEPYPGDDKDKTFPLGCEATIPLCSPFYRNSRRTFWCSGGSINDAGVIEYPPGWGEGL